MCVQAFNIPVFLQQHPILNVVIDEEDKRTAVEYQLMMKEGKKSAL